MSTFPTSYDNLSNPNNESNQLTLLHSAQHANANDAIEAIEGYIGTSSETVTSTLTGKVKRLDKFTTKGDILGFDGTNPIRIPKASNGKLLSYDDTTATGLSAIDPIAGGTVTITSVVSANGFTGSVANPTTTPAITLGTSVTGLLKGNGTAVSSATAGTDYYAPSGTDVAVADGGTGVSSLTAYGVIVGGTTSTAPVQSIAVGTTGQVLTSNGAGASPSMQTIPDSWTLLKNDTVSGVTSYDSGTITAYDKIKIEFDCSSNSATEFGLQINGNTSGAYKSTYFTDSGIYSTSSTTSLYCIVTTLFGNYLTLGEIIFKGKGSKKLAIGNISSSGGNRLLDGIIDISGDLTSIQLTRTLGTGTLTGTIKIFGK